MVKKIYYFAENFFFHHTSWFFMKFYEKKNVKLLQKNFQKSQKLNFFDIK